MEPSLARAEAEQAARRDAHHRPRLRIAGRQRIFPHVAPRGEALERIGLEPQRQHPGKARARAGQRDRRHVAGAQKRDHKERHKEDDGRAEVVHQREAAADGRRIADEHHQISLCHQAVQRRRARIHEADLHQLRRLERHAAQLDPVARAELFRAEHEVHRQKQNTSRRGEVAEHLRPLEVAQRPPHKEEHDKSRAEREKFLQQTLRCARRHDGEAHRREEKRDGLHIKAASPHQLQPEKQRPFHQHQTQKRQQHLRPPPAAHHGQERHQQLKHREQQQRHRRRHAHAAAPARLGLDLLLLRRDRHERELHAAETQHIAEFHLCKLHWLAVQLRPGFRPAVEDRPAPIVIPRQDRVRPRDRRVFEQHIAAPSAAQQIFPVRHGDAVARLRRQPCPDLRLAPERQQRHRAPRHDQDRQQRHHIPQHAASAAHFRQRLQPRAQIFQNRFHISSPKSQSAPRFPERRSTVKVLAVLLSLPRRPAVPPGPRRPAAAPRAARAAA